MDLPFLTTFGAPYRGLKTDFVHQTYICGGLIMLFGNEQHMQGLQLPLYALLCDYVNVSRLIFCTSTDLHSEWET